MRQALIALALVGGVVALVLLPGQLGEAEYRKALRQLRQLDAEIDCCGSGWTGRNAARCRPVLQRVALLRSQMPKEPLPANCPLLAELDPSAPPEVVLCGVLSTPPERAAAARDAARSGRLAAAIASTWCRDEGVKAGVAELARSFASACAAHLCRPALGRAWVLGPLRPDVRALAREHAALIRSRLDVLFTAAGMDAIDGVLFGAATGDEQAGEALGNLAAHGSAAKLAAVVGRLDLPEVRSALGKMRGRSTLHTLLHDAAGGEPASPAALAEAARTLDCATLETLSPRLRLDDPARAQAIYSQRCGRILRTGAIALAPGVLEAALAGRVSEDDLRPRLGAATDAERRALIEQAARGHPKAVRMVAWHKLTREERLAALAPALASQDPSVLAAAGAAFALAGQAAPPHAAKACALEHEQKASDEDVCGGGPLSGAALQALRAASGMNVPDRTLD